MLPAGSLEAEELVPPLPGYQPATSWVHYTTSCNIQFSAPGDGRDHRSKHVELIGIINKPLLLHLVGVCITYVNDARSNKYRIQLFLEAYVKCLYKTLTIYCMILPITKHLLVAWITVLRFSFQRNRVTSFPPDESYIFCVCFSSHSNIKLLKAKHISFI